jgi:LuxR family maltose regulon positive regulatory protein
LAEKWVKTWGIGGYLVLALVQQSQGDEGAAHEAIHQALQLAQEYDATEIDDITVLAYQARLCLMQGNVPAAARWAEEQKPGQAKFYSLQEIEFITLAWVQIAQGQPAEALATLQPLLPQAMKLGRTGNVIDILTLQALAHQAQGDEAQALVALERALELAEPQGYVRVFVDKGLDMARLLNRVPTEYAGKLLAAFADRTKDERQKTEQPRSLSSVPGSSSLVEPLSERELDVLRLIAAGMTNRQIAETLVVALGTAKAHTANIYSKLEVHNRTQAVARARELGLL